MYFITKFKNITKTAVRVGFRKFTFPFHAAELRAGIKMSSTTDQSPPQVQGRRRQDRAPSETRPAVRSTLIGFFSA
jgi:hypothetical protein